MSKVGWLLLAPLLVNGLRPGAFLRDPVTLIDQNRIPNGEPSYSWSEEHLDVPIDHFAFADTREFPLRYFINLTYYEPGGPIFFYTGNEGKLEVFAENTGFIWDIAPEYKAAIVFTEHRFYGNSLPFGEDSYKHIKNLGYLTSEQALADFADVITYLKTQRIPQATHSPVIVFGGSYGGMLAAWFRIKYPHLADGAIAASAPLLWFQNTGVRQDGYANITTRTFKLSGCDLTHLRASFDAMRTLAKTEDGRDHLNKVLKLGKSSEFEHSHDYNILVNIFADVMGNVVMIDYPYPTNFFAQVPAWPVKKMCEKFNGDIPDDPKETVKPLYDILNIFYNTSGKLEEFCLRGPDCGNDQLGAMDGWNWQICTEMIMPICNSGLPDDVFDKTCPFVITADFERCHKQYSDIGYEHNLYRPNWVIEHYGAEFPSASNIVFSNGYLDPWSAGGWKLEPATEGTLVSLIIEDGAHHYDLRAAHPDDTPQVKQARLIEKENIDRWIGKARARPSQQFKRKKTEKTVGQKPAHKHHTNHRHYHRHQHHLRSEVNGQ
ncbi:unnamed protein product [Bursaphelenchus xylophilus]|uniref:(pine wood nematode) hypothetical protein n=1 Tax=Bursaphelenchus xylophilus TaxID=6326 RepID=A0A1I7SQY6_BURXY|nr:unnamed protein product [Bursaphelenchus xylophilus]CAG9110570.1 unnamed protein product [Bursaphelenchus xylophilus]